MFWVGANKKVYWPNLDFTNSDSGETKMDGDKQTLQWNFGVQIKIISFRPRALYRNFPYILETT